MQRWEQTALCKVCGVSFATLSLQESSAAHRQHCRRCSGAVCGHCLSYSSVHLPNLGICEPAQVCTPCDKALAEAEEDGRAAGRAAALLSSTCQLARAILLN